MWCHRRQDGYGGGQRTEVTVREYADWWRGREAGQEADSLYLKDWHFVNEFPDCKVGFAIGLLWFLARKKCAS